MRNNPAFIVALVLGAGMLLSVCIVYVKSQTLGFGGVALSGFAVILVGMSVWKSIGLSIDDKGINLRLDQVEKTAREAKESAEEAQKKVELTKGDITGLKNRFDLVVTQEKLKSLGLYTGIPDGEMNSATKLALRRFQQSKNLSPTEGLDAPTKSALGIPVN